MELEFDFGEELKDIRDKQRKLRNFKEQISVMQKYLSGVSFGISENIEAIKGTLGHFNKLNKDPVHSHIIPSFFNEKDINNLLVSFSKNLMYGDSFKDQISVRNSLPFNDLSHLSCFRGVSRL